ncbi:protein SPIRAL1-like 1 [Phragmites australis]|uniref:protein SPIRAL1-like 1 n=1 Tax=Phragmites australis TaxID=29695 RepID=UPI002D771E98|nr:protein SPIRAL1-like 1 [Phragmites australis]
MQASISNGSGARQKRGRKLQPAPATDPISAAVPRRCPCLSSLSLSTVKMSRGGSAGGGQSSLGYLFGGGEAPPPKPAVAPAAPAAPAASAPPGEKPAAAKAEVSKQIPAGIASQTNNYHRADGQNTGNFLTDRPSTKVHAAPGGGSSLGYLFGGN